MKARINFEFDPDDPLELYSARDILNIGGFKRALSSFSEELRQRCKYGKREGDPDTLCLDTVEYIKKIFYEIIEEEEVSID